MGRRKHGKKKKLTTDQLKSVLLKYFQRNPKKRLNASQLSKKLHLINSKDSVSHALNELRNEDFLRPISDRKYVLNKKRASEVDTPENQKTYIGSVEMIRSGAAYIVVEGLDKDVYVPARHLNSALNKDEVEISVRFYKSKKPEGRVVKVIKRNTTRVLGTLQASRSSGVVSFKSRKSELDVFISPKNYAGAKDGDKVLVDIVSWGEGGDKMVWGKVVRILNDLDTHDWTMESILVENGFNSDYPPEVMKEVEAISDIISDDEISKRRDFRDILCFTIDPDTAQDFDDAISFQKLDNGHLEVGIHIADVTHYLQEGSALDKEAFNRSTSVYLVDRCIAMLPEKLSNNLCSLVPNKDRLVFSAVFEFDNNSKIVSQWFGKGIIHSDHRFTYDGAQASMDTEDGHLHQELKVLNKIAGSLRKERFKNGGINFETDELKFRLDENNKPIGVFVKERKPVHMLIEDFMLLANRRVAKFMATKSKENPIPFIYRIHDLPDIDKLMDLKDLLGEYDVKMDLSNPAKIAASFNILSERAQKEDKYKLLMSFAIRTMAKAVYSTDNIGHYGLSFEYYTHFTSPIRRYSDVIVHRLLNKNLGNNYRTDKAKLETQCVHISNQERRAMDAERDSVKFKQVEYMKEHEGEEFTGMVSGMIEKGIFVEVGETKAEGLISFDKLDDSFLVKENRIKAIGTRKGRNLRLGDKVRVKIIKADLQSRLIEMELTDYLDD
jgi:ribonuclease R